MPCIDPFRIRPVVRDCTCPPPARKPGEHSAECAAAFKAKLVNGKQELRDSFYETPRKHLL